VARAERMSVSVRKQMGEFRDLTDFLGAEHGHSIASFYSC
jgi:hypothetical protein